MSLLYYLLIKDTIKQLSYDMRLFRKIAPKDNKIILAGSGIGVILLIIAIPPTFSNVYIAPSGPNSN